MLVFVVYNFILETISAYGFYAISFTGPLFEMIY